MKVGQLNQRSTADRESQGLARRPVGKVNRPADLIEGSSRRRPSDDQIWLKIKDKTGATNSTSFQQLDENKREEIFLELKDCGASLRQLERLTGIGKGVIHRIWCAGR